MYTILMIGGVMMIVSLAVAVLMFELAARCIGWMERSGVLGHGNAPLVFNLAMALIWILFVLSGSIWAWALFYMHLGVFETMETALYFSLISFTTVGFGDVVLAPGVRLYSGMTATHGLLVFGLFTAFLIEVLKRSRPIEKF